MKMHARVLSISKFPVCLRKCSNLVRFHVLPYRIIAMLAMVFLNPRPHLGEGGGYHGKDHKMSSKVTKTQSWDSVLFWYRRYRYWVLENRSFGFGISVLS